MTLTPRSSKISRSRSNSTAQRGTPELNRVLAALSTPAYRLLVDPDGRPLGPRRRNAY
ncbi:hypothetical protein [Streptomyces thermolilacinus]|uniref:hypothetical protein n=1 Tax=Streptomyces thermolilacinus TaxID=285540 RepID=UPI0013747644|nr:hypothetical protein [Streptomyces thermolilacinus]